ncbi:MAG: arylsulfatase [Cyclobacterium sp.]|uniref:arylsulfatase n=1 Tax=unclassified Cyclobacterium TaxID=2615055 RepID=UPI0013D3A1F6|nr:arylsulfatase [Cyclobacterium sp. SYSU L10401]
MKLLCYVTLGSMLLFSPRCSNAFQEDRPNVILIITDDQGYGDLGIHGNPHLQTPHLDQFARESIRLNQFYVSPVCAPTRSSLMTGRFSLRTGMRDTYNGGAIMATAEVTIAEMLKEVGYSTGIFGKWHLGDNYPFRPADQGFDESLIHLSGGMGQPGDFTTYFKGDSSYFDPVLWYNGQQKAYEGYCSDIYTSEAISFLENNRDNPFFLYLSFNAPHTPLQVPEEYYNMYKDIDPASGFEADERPFPEMSEKDKEDARKVYAMVSNIDDNVGKLLEKLEELDIADNTLVVFMTDNGPQQPRYLAGMRGRKGSVFRGGVRVPFFLRLPDRLPGNKDVSTTLAHIDVLPTLAEICAAPLPENRKIDGKSFHALLRGEAADEFENRSLFFYWTRRYPELYNNVALHKGDFKLVGHTDHDAPVEAFDLFNVKEDPYEQHNMVHENIPLARSLKAEMDEMMAELTQSPQLNQAQRMIIGSEHENPVFLNRNDAGGERGIWTQEEVFGMWKVKTLEGRYNIRFKFIKPLETQGRMVLETNSVILQEQYEDLPTDEINMEDVYLPEMEVDLIPHYVTEGRSIFPLWVELEKITGP